MSILVEIAEQAHVSVEGVIRVLTREPVSDAVLERVLGVLDDLTPEQTRAVQRFALAALHDVLPRPLDAEEIGEVPELGVAEGQLALPEPDEPAPEQLPASPSDAALVQLSSVLSELAEAVRDLRRETDAERRERVDDLAVLIDLITTGWQGLDARLGRIEKQVARIDTGRRPSAAPLAVPLPAPQPATVVEETTVEPLPPVQEEPETRRSRVPLAAALALAGAVIGTFVVLQLSSTGPDVAALVSARDEPAETGQGSSSTTGAAETTEETTPPATTTSPRTTTTAPRTTTRPPAVPPPSPTTSSVLGTSVGETQPPRKPPATTPATTTPATTATPSFRPTRNWAWAPVPNADYYSVEFTRGGTTFYRATPAEPRLTLPDTLVFGPGTYRWVVRAGFGQRAARRLGKPVVNSGFTVS